MTVAFQQSGRLKPYPYAVKYALDDDLYALDSPVYRLEVDESAMSASNVLATVVRDRQGDILETEGVDFSEHRLNPVAMLDHGRQHSLAIGVTRSPSGLYTVDHRGDVITEKTYFSQRSEVAAQVFGLIAEGILRGNSIGFRKIKASPLAPDPSRGFLEGKDARGNPTPAGLHITQSALIEVTWTSLPVNPEAVAKALGQKWDGKPLNEILRDTLCRYAPPRKIYAHGFRPLCKDMAAGPALPMSATDQSAGGAFVPPPTGGGHFGQKLSRNRRAFKSGFKCGGLKRADG